MLRVRLFLLTLIGLLGGIFFHEVQAQQARIKIDPDRAIDEVSPLIYGSFVEHLGRCVYGGIYEPGSPLADEDGLRKDVLQAVRELGVTILRYPGGNFVSNYHWLDGVGPERKPRLDLAWHVLEPNTFGTNEFMKFMRKVGAESYFTVNMGTGTIEEAQWWVEYTNVKEGPYYAELRKQHGFPEPYGIKFWSLGNEMDGFWQLGHLNAEDYAKKAREAAKLMKATDPSIRLIAAGSSDFRPGADPQHWNRVVLEELKDYIDYIALHMYVGNPDDNYYNFVATPLEMERRTAVVKGLIQQVLWGSRRERPIYIAWDEYNVWYRARAGEALRGRRALEERYNLEDALVIAGFLNGFIRNADIVKMANLAQLVNVIAPIFTNEQGMFKQTIYYPFQLFARNAHGVALDAFVDGPTYDTEEFFVGLGERSTKLKDVPYLDVSVVYEPKSGRIVINVVNRHKDRTLTAELVAQEGRFQGPFEVYEVNGPDIKAENDFGMERVKTVRKPDVQVNNASFSYAFPPHSFTQLIGRLVH